MPYARPYDTILALAPTGVLAEEGARVAHPPLDLSLPKEAEDRTWDEPPSRDATRLPDLGGQPEGPGSRGGARGERGCASLWPGEAQHETLLRIDGCTVFRAASSPHIGVSPAYG